MSQASQPDDNMIPGQTYTFQLKLQNWITSPNTSTVQQDLQANAPDFMGSLQVTEEDTLNPLSNIYDVQFTYNGDGTDVISDVASSLLSAIQQGSGDSFAFIAAYPQAAGSISGTGISDQITGTLTDIVDKLGKQTSKTTQDILTPVEIAVGIVVVLVVFLIFTAGKAGGASAGPEGVSVGGSR